MSRHALHQYSRYVVKTSTNVIDWTPAYTNPDIGATIIYTDINPTEPARFYRVAH
jgi:hypothetical protein